MIFFIEKDNSNWNDSFCWHCWACSTPGEDIEGSAGCEKDFPAGASCWFVGGRGASLERGICTEMLCLAYILSTSCFILLPDRCYDNTFSSFLHLKLIRRTSIQEIVWKTQREYITGYVWINFDFKQTGFNNLLSSRNWF